MKSRRTPSLLAALVALVAFAGCGAENTLSSLDQPLDSAPPSAPTNVRGEMRGALSVLAWDASPDADVVGYDIYQYAPDPTRESAYVRINATPIAAEEFVVTTGAEVNAWYRVKAVDQSGNRSSSTSAEYVEGIASPGGTAPADDLPILR